MYSEELRGKRTAGKPAGPDLFTTMTGPGTGMASVSIGPIARQAGGARAFPAPAGYRVYPVADRTGAGLLQTDSLDMQG